MDRERSIQRYPCEIKVDVIPSSNAGRDLGQMAEDFQDERNKKNPDSEQNTLTHDAIKKMKLPQIEMPKIDPKKSGFEKWNEAVDTAYKKNQDLIEGMSGIGSVMGSLGQAVGGAAGEWLNWGANVVQAVAAAIPQITSLLGLQTTQVAQIRLLPAPERPLPPQASRLWVLYSQLLP